ncbi:DUF2189 domain-containing protein [Parafrigoribacterium soli]|uniref:hypothetical protein n=1 Tax=Parafrigoribacterium soli TaxID=3144663 RepID=UPI0032EE7BF5
MRIGKTGGAVATLALVSLFVFGGAEAAHADDFTLAPFDSSGATNSSLHNASQPPIHGTAEHGTTVTVKSSNPDTGVADYCVVAVDYYGTWSCPSGPDVAFGSTTFTATDGHASVTSATITVYGPNGPTLTSPASGAVIQPNTTFEGSGPARGSIRVITDSNQTLCTVTVVPDSGQWSCTPSNPVPAATTGVLVEASTPGSPSDTFYTQDGALVPMTVDDGSESGSDPPPTVAPNPPTMGYEFSPAAVAITGTGDPHGEGTHIEIYVVNVGAGEGNTNTFTPYPGCSRNGGDEGTAFATAELSTTQVCTLSDLAPGVWNVFSWQAVGGEQSLYQDDYFRVPAAPTVTAQSSAPQSVTLSGSGTTGDIVSVFENGAEVCQATVVAGAWSCTISTTAGPHSYTASELDQGLVVPGSGNYGDSNLYNAVSALSAPAEVSVADLPGTPTTPTTPTTPVTPTTPTTPVTPEAPGTPVTPVNPVIPPKHGTAVTPPVIPTLFFWVLNVSGGDAPLRAGDVVTVSSSGLPVGASVNFELHSTPRSLGSMVVQADGTFARTLVIPDDVEPGDHHIVVTVTPIGDAPSPQQAAITIVPVDAVAVTSAAAGADDAGGASTTASKHHSRTPSRDAITAPSSFTNALPTVSALFENPGVLAIAAALALAIMLLVALPTEILDSAVSSNLDRFGPLIARAGAATERATAWLNRVTRGSAASSVVMIVLSSIIFGFADPSYGFDLVSLRLTVSIVLALVVVYFIAPKISGAIIRRRWGVSSDISIQPTALIFAIIGVVIGRLLGFSPGFLIGLAIGLELAASAALRHRARSMAVQVGVIVGLALLAWVGYSLIALGVGDGTGTIWTGLVQDALATVTAEGLTGMLLGLFPLTFFEGKAVWEHSKWLWASLFLVTATAFAFLVLPTAIAPREIAQSLPVWLFVLGCFTVLTLALWLYLRLTTKPEAEPDNAAEVLESVER